MRIRTLPLSPLHFALRTAERSVARHPHAPAAGAADGAAAVGAAAASSTTDGTSARELVDDDGMLAADERLLCEVAAAAALVSRGTAARVVVCNAAASIDLDEVRRLVAGHGVAVDQVVRVGGGGIDLAIVPIPTRG